jgi:hypothetical protein
LSITIENDRVIKCRSKRINPVNALTPVAGMGIAMPVRNITVKTVQKQIAAKTVVLNLITVHLRRHSLHDILHGYAVS